MFIQLRENVDKQRKLEISYMNTMRISKRQKLLLKEFKSTLEPEERISEFEDKTRRESKNRKEKRMKKSELSLKDKWDSSNGQTYALWEYQKEKRKEEAEKLLEEIMTKNFQNLIKI